MLTLDEAFDTTKPLKVLPMRPLHDGVLYEPIALVGMSKGGIDLSAAQEERSFSELPKGKVLAVGPGAWNPGGSGSERLPMQIAVGDVVTIMHGKGNMTKHDGVDYGITREIFCITRERKELA